jgi:hypothetical protein
VRPTLPVATPAAATNGEAAPVVPTVDPSKFPGGIVPTKLPPRMMIKGIKRGR